MPVSPACFNSSLERFSDEQSMVKTRSSSFQQTDLMYGTPLSGLLTYYVISSASRSRDAERLFLD